MNDFELYASGILNPDERAWWDHVTEMIADAGEYDGYLPETDTDTGADDEFDY